MSRADTVLARSQAQTKQGYIGTTTALEREKDDFYPTPPMATERLLDVEKFDGDIWECACGDGAISKVLEQHNYKVYSTDLINRNYGETGIDFLMETQKCDNIITNPPFKLSLPFVYKAIELANKKVAFLCRITFLEGVARKKMFQETPLENVYIFSRRITFTNPNNGFKTHGGGMLAFAWFVRNKEHKGKPELNWI